MVRKIAIFHFGPLESYPPVMNFLDCLAKELPAECTVTVYTTTSLNNSGLYVAATPAIRIKRIAKFTLGLAPANRMWQYARFFGKSLFATIGSLPHHLFYYETISSFVPCTLKRIFGKRVKLSVHYHEYMAPAEYKNMFQNRLFHRIEKKTYARASWISHTNGLRMEQFLRDLGNPALTNTHIYPNYPPESWAGHVVKHDEAELPVKIVYVGSLGSMESFYIRETFEWIKSQSGKIVLDLYSFNIATDVSDYLQRLNCEFIRVKGKVDYKALPGILPQYQVGLIFYKGGALNTIYSASNKLFEFLVCGLDVWYPQEILGTHAYDSVEYWPKVLRLDFSRLDKYQLESLVERKRGYGRTIDYTCEKTSKNLIACLTS